MYLHVPPLEGSTAPTLIGAMQYLQQQRSLYVVMENVLVPCENLLGQENKGFACIVQNFNHERWMMVINTLTGCRLALKDCVLWATQRKAFGKALLQQPVIQAKISEMAAQVEALTAWLDTVTYQVATCFIDVLSRDS